MALTTPRLATVLAFLALALLSRPADGQDAGRWDRGSFTLHLNLGVGFQHDSYFEQTETGLAGLNLGIGGFLTDDVALMFRWSGTTGVSFEHYSQTSAVYGPAVQYWIDDRLAVEAGAGVGMWRAYNAIVDEDVIESSLGMILGVGYTLFGAGKHGFRVGLEYAPAFTEPAWVHNFGIVLGWQLL